MSAEEIGISRSCTSSSVLPYGKYRRCDTRASLGPDDIEEYASVIVVQVGHVVGKAGEVVADASLQILANASIERRQDAAAGLIDIRQAKLSHLGQSVPLFPELPIHAQHRELRGIVEQERLCGSYILKPRSVPPKRWLSEYKSGRPLAQRPS